MLVISPSKCLMHPTNCWMQRPSSLKSHRQSCIASLQVSFGGKILSKDVSQVEELFLLVNLIRAAQINRGIHVGTVKTVDHMSWWRSWTSILDNIHLHLLIKYQVLVDNKRLYSRMYHRKVVETYFGIRNSNKFALFALHFTSESGIQSWCLKLSSPKTPASKTPSNLVSAPVRVIIL